MEETKIIDAEVVEEEKVAPTGNNTEEPATNPEVEPEVPSENPVETPVIE